MNDFDKAAFAERMRLEKQQYNEKLTAAMTAMAADPAKFQSYLNVQGKLPAYSVGNAIMVAMQCPAAKKVKLASEWTELGVKPLRGQNGITILVPGKQYIRNDGSVAQGYDVRRAFDISQTTEAANGQMLNRPSNHQLMHGILEYQKGAWLYFTVDEGDPVRYYSDNHTIVLRRQQQFTSLFPLLAREIFCADLLLRKNLGRFVSEPLANCAAWMLCAHYDIEPIGIQLPNPKTIMGEDPAKYRQRLTNIVEPLRSLLNFMERDIAKNRNR